MKTFQRSLLIKLTFIAALFVLIKSANVAKNNTNSIFAQSLQQRRRYNLYPASTANLIAKYFKDYKHIKQLTLFLCDDSLSPQPTFMMPFQRNDNLTNISSLLNQQHVQFDDEQQQRSQQIYNDHKLKHKHESHADRSMNFQQIVNHLMVSGNFLIKGDGNIDAVEFADIGTNAADDKHTHNNYNGESDDNENFAFIYAYNVPDMLKNNDFKQGAVLDLRCYQSKYILQQVSRNEKFILLNVKENMKKRKRQVSKEEKEKIYVRYMANDINTIRSLFYPL